MSKMLCAVLSCICVLILGVCSIQCMKHKTRLAKYISLLLIVNTLSVAGYTLIYNSHGMRIKAHQPFESVEKVLIENKDIESSSDSFETEPFRVMVENTDVGKVLADNIKDLEELLYAYREGIIMEQTL